MHISIIIPTRNESKIIEDTLEQFQSYRDQLEIIISDGGSTNKTIQKATPYVDHIIIADPKIKQNIATGKNSGAKKAKGDILIFLDADVRVSDIDIFLEQVRIFAQRKEKYMTCPVFVFPENTRIIDTLFHALFNRYIQLCALLGHGWARGECQIYKRDFFEELGGYNEDLIASEDYEICIRAMKRSNIWWNKKVSIYESGRRYRKIGYLKTVILWAKNTWHMRTKGVSYSEKWEEVR